MKNPCKECLLINNCTAICEEKNNLKTLIENAIQLYHFGLECKSKEDRKRYGFWMTLRSENEKDMLKIVNRAERLKEGQYLI
jgi:hypothetical protein